MSPRVPSPDRPWLLAHRGDRAAGPENSRRSVVAAFGTCDGAEVDVVVTSDGVPVLRHDDRLADGTAVRSLTVSELRRATAASDDDLPTFADVLDALGDRLARGVWNVELKAPGAARALRPFAARLSGVIFTSFFVTEVMDAGRWFEGVPVGLLTAHAPIPYVPPGVQWLSVRHPALAAVRVAHPTRPLLAWTVNDAAAAARARAAGCLGWIGDDVAALERLRDG